MSDQTTAGDDSEIDVFDAFARLRAELGIDSENLIIRLYRLDKRGARAGNFLSELSGDEFSMMTVKTLYGGGHFRARITKPSGEFVANQAFSIEGKPKMPDEENNVPRETQRDTVGERISAVEQAMQAQLQVLARLGERLSQPAPAPAPSSGAGLAEITALISAIAPLLSRHSAPAPSQDAAEILLRGVALGKELAGVTPPEKEEPDVMGLIGKGLDTFAPLLSSIAQTQNAQAAPRVVRVPPKPAVNKVVPQNATQGNAAMETVQKIVGEIKTSIQAGETAEMCAERTFTLVAPYISMIPLNFAEQLAAYDKFFSAPDVQVWLKEYFTCLNSTPPSDAVDDTPAM